MIETEHDSHQEDVTAGKYKNAENETISHVSEMQKEIDIDNKNKALQNLDETAAPAQKDFLQRPKDGGDSTSNACPADYKNEGNLLNSVVTMHTTNCDDEYSPTLAICDIFSNTKASSDESETIKEEDAKDEFLIIDLDTCQMERGSKNENVCKEVRTGQNNSKSHIKSPSNGLILVNLSSEDIQSDFLNTSSNENNFLVKQECDNSYDLYNHSTEKQTNGYMVYIEKRINEEKEMNITPKMKEEPNNTAELSIPTNSGFSNDLDCMSSKGTLFNDLKNSQDSSMSKEMYSHDMCFINSSDLNNVSFQSHQNEDCGFFMPEVYTKFHDGKDKNNDRFCDFSKLPVPNSNVTTVSSSDYYANIDNASLLASQHNPAAHVFYEHHQIQNLPYYSLEDKNMNKTLPQLTRSDLSPTQGMASYQKESMQHVYTNTTGSRKQPCYSTFQEHTSPFFPSSYIPSYRAPYPYNLQNTATTSNPQFLTSPISNYSDWNFWNDSTLYEVSLNTNQDSEYQQFRDNWSNDTIVTDINNDPQINMKSNLTDVDSEATEDADETDEVPMFLENSTDFSTCDNLSNMSVMSSSCYSDTSSVMAPLSPSDFTPPPSASNTPIPPPHHDINTYDNKYGGPFLIDNYGIYSPSLHSLPPYQLSSEETMQKNGTYGQCIRRQYSSMADMHNPKLSLCLPSTSSKFEDNDIVNFTDNRKSHKSQIQSDKISTSNTRNTCNKRKWNDPGNDINESMESFADYVKYKEDSYKETECSNDLRRSRHNEPLKQSAIRIMSGWYEQHLDNPYPSKEDKMRMAQDGGVTITQVKSWFANKRNRTNNTKPKVQKRAMKEKLKKLFQDLKHSRTDSLDNSHIIQQLSGIIHN